MSVKVRFAPSPTGLLHVGNARAALINWLFARRRGGTFVLRIDDTDASRSEEAYVDAIRRDLRWLGLDWDEEARQSARLDRYTAAAARLEAAGRLYPCYETAEELDIKRRMQRARGLPPVYDRAALKLTDDDRAALEAEGKRPHWRFLLERDSHPAWEDMIRGRQAVDPASLSDPVLIRADGTFLYMLPSTVDDIELGITHVIRGEDHVTNSGEQIQIFEALGATPPAMAHYPLISAKSGEKFSKRAGSGTLEALREEAGLEPEAIAAFLARIGSADPVEPVTDIRELVEGFDIGRYSKSAAKFDPGELDHLNARILHAMPFDRVRSRPGMDGVSEELWRAVRGNLEHLREVADWRRVVEGPVTPLIEETDAAFLKEAADSLPAMLDDTAWARWTAELKTASGRKGKALFMPLRKALTGRAAGPEMAALLPLIGADRARARLRGETA